MTDLLAGISPWRTERTEWLWTELELIGARWRVSDHPMMTALAEGWVEDERSAIYVAEHDHALVAGAALAECSRGVGGFLGRALAAHAHYRREQLARWRAAAVAAGWSAGRAWHYGRAPFAATTAYVRAITGTEDEPAAQIVTLRALLSVEADISAALGGRTRRYNLGGAQERERLDAALQGLLANVDPFELLQRADRVHRLYGHLLDDLATYRSGNPLTEIR